MDLPGSSAVMTQAGPMSMPAPSARSWLPRIGALGLAGVVAAALLGGYGIVIFRLRHSAAGKAAVTQVRGSTQLQAMLGAPLRVRIEGGELQHDGHASFSMRVRGSHGAAQVEVEVQSKQRVWSVVRGKVTPEASEELALDASALPQPQAAKGAANPAMPR